MKSNKTNMVGENACLMSVNKGSHVRKHLLSIKNLLLKGRDIYKGMVTIGSRVVRVFAVLTAFFNEIAPHRAYCEGYPLIYISPIHNLHQF